jgi:hypothetical protein
VKRTQIPSAPIADLLHPTQDTASDVKNGFSVMSNATPNRSFIVRETEILATDTRHQYRQKLARIVLDEMYQFVAVLNAEGTLLEVNRAALEGVSAGVIRSEAARPGRRGQSGHEPVRKAVSGRRLSGALGV